MVSEHDQDVVSWIGPLRAFARTLCRNLDDADDLVQETLVKALANIHQFETGTKMKSWLFTIMRNTFYTRAKLKARESPAAEDDVAARPAIDPSQEWRARGLELSEAIERLPDKQREVLVLVGALGVSYDEAADICDCNIGTIKSRLNRARMQLIQELEENSAGSTVEWDINHPVASLDLDIRQNSAHTRQDF